MMKKLLIFLMFFAVLSCKEDEGTIIWRVWYAVQLPPDHDLKITYNSDKYFDSGVRDTVFVHDSSYVQYLDGFWIGQRLQDDKKNGYYINVQIDSLTPYDGHLGVFVYANDTTLLDSVCASGVRKLDKPCSARSKGTTVPFLASSKASS